jgi:molybdopterin-guanine dinucleotide biosynthesis protein A
MAENHLSPLVAAVVLAGGASSRMGQPKALMAFRGRPLAARALDRLRPQAGKVYLNVREPGAEWTALGAPLVVDAPAHRGAGPLAGIASALARAQADGFTFLVTAPCDAPFLPRDLVARLRLCGAGAAVARSPSGVEPMFALWPVSALGQVEAALLQGRASPGAVLAALGAAEAPFAGVAFVNLNNPREFADAEAGADLIEGEAPAQAGPKGVIE